MNNKKEYLDFLQLQMKEKENRKKKEGDVSIIPSTSIKPSESLSNQQYSYSSNNPISSFDMSNATLVWVPMFIPNNSGFANFQNSSQSTQITHIKSTKESNVQPKGDTINGLSNYNTGLKESNRKAYLLEIQAQIESKNKHKKEQLLLEQEQDRKYEKMFYSK